MRNAEELAKTLDWLVDNGRIPGLLPVDVRAAASLLRVQDEKLKLYQQALAAKRHEVNVRLVPEHGYMLKLEANFIMADPVIYGVEQRVAEHPHLSEPEWQQELARAAVSIAQARQREDLLGKAYLGVRNAVRTLQSEREKTE